MRNKTSFWKRSLAALLCLVMVLGMIPAFGFAPMAYAAGEEGDTTETPAAPEGNYITLPITIRDFAADGMLFEWNEVGAPEKTLTVGGDSIVGYSIIENPTSWDLGAGNYTGFRLYDSGNLTFDSSNTGYAWHCVIVDKNTGNVVKVLANQETKNDGTYDNAMQSDYFSMWVRSGDEGNYAVLSKITEANKNNYRIDFNSAQMYIGYAYSENTWGSHNGTNYTGISYFDAGTDPFVDNYDALWADCLICDSEGKILQIVGAGTEKKAAIDAMQTGQFALFATGNDSFAQSLIRSITADNMSEYRFSIYADTYYENKLLYLLSVGESAKTYHQADTQGFTFLQTDDKDYSNVFPGTDDTVNPIAGTERVQLGSWNSQPTDEIKTMTLNSNAVQTLLGGWIRTNLVAPELDDDNKPVYTQATVEFLAGYMADVMSQPWQNDDGSYNTFHVEGVKLFDAGYNYVPVGSSIPKVHDLADYIRYKIENNGLDNDMGSYTASHDKFLGKIQDKQLDTADDIETWCDAAYYLLHYYWRDSSIESRGAGIDGYGMNMPAYTSLHLVEQVKDGKTYYVFNSGYDYTEYDYENGAIWNTQTNTMTTDTNTPYVYGNPLTTNRFDPLGPSGAGDNYGYGMSGDTYGDMITEKTGDNYDNTNYHLSLEGHAEFIFHYASDLYFTFTGDDDVYLYINGIRVLDVGAAHSIAKVRVDLNDIAARCGLKEGEPARFDFFYLERHGTAANFGIETNIQLAEAGMITTKEGYQSGVLTGYDGPVDPQKPVAYSFTLTNSSDATLTDLTFVDEALGVNLNQYSINWGKKIEGTNPDGSLVGNGPIDNMYVYIRDENNTIVTFYSAATATKLTDEKLQELLRDGLEAGQSMTIYNLRYTIPNTEWTLLSGETNESFTNTVVTTAMANGKQLHGSADWKVHKQELSAEPFHIYNWVDKLLNETQWRSKTVNLTKDELTQPVVDAGESVGASADVVLCNGAGLEDRNLWSTDYTNIINNVTLDGDDKLTYNSTAPGMVSIYYKIKNIGYDSFIFHFDVITYGVVENVYVLDYGLNVKLNCDDYGFRVNDHLSVPQNIHEKNITMTMDVREDEDQWGDFVVDDEETQGLHYKTSVEYQPKDIIDGSDSMTVTLHLRESGDHSNKALKFYGLDMYQKVSTAPANVVYYEENHPGITYVSEGENQWIHYETVDENGNSVAGENQSPDQDSNYGSDPNYETDKEGVLSTDAPVENTTTLELDTSDLNAMQEDIIDALNDYFGLGGADSNGTVNKLEVKQTATVMYFDFIGTGFEIISRTTFEEYAVINVQVQTKNADGTYSVCKQLPVITESVGGVLYQIPIISITGLPKDEYRVVVQAGTTGNVNRVFYVDGIRIYGPLGEDKAAEYYNPAEYEAEFYEVKSLIESGHMTYMDLNYTEDTVLGFMTGTTMVEDTEDGAILKSVSDIYTYLSVGPNNELYMDGNGNVNVLTFTLKPVAGHPDNARTLQIGAHRKANFNAESFGSAMLTYATDPQTIYNDLNTYINGEIPATNAYTISSGTEMYYTIDVDNLTPRADGSYLIMIAAIGSEWYDTNLVLTNIKVAGYTVSHAEIAIVNADQKGDLDGEPIVEQTFNLLKTIRSLFVKEPDVEQVPVNEELFIDSAALSASKVVSGRTVSLTVKAGTDAEKLVVTDSEGNEVTATKCTRKVVRGVATFTFTWKVTGSSGQTLNYNVRVYDANDLASVNTETVTVTIR